MFIKEKQRVERERKKASGGTLYSTMQPLVWLPAVVLLHCPPAKRWQCDAATSGHSMTSRQQAKHMLAYARHCFSYSV